LTGAAPRLHSVRRRHRRARVGHPDLGAVRLEHDRVVVVEPVERWLDVVTELGLQLGEWTRPSELDEAQVDVVADPNVAVVHQCLSRKAYRGARHADTSKLD